MSEAPVAGIPWLSGYLAGHHDAGGHDALWDGQAVRAEWQSLSAWIDTHGMTGVEELSREGQRLFREDGIGYDVGRERDDRAWELDPLPYIVSAAEWRTLEAGLKQRARLLDLVLKDLYGPGHALRSGLLPPQLVFRNAGFLRAAHRSFETNRPALRVYAADVVRAADGEFRVLRDRAQLPSGAGLALETRIVCSRLLHHLIRGSHTYRHAEFFNAMRQMLEGMAPNNRLSPRVVLLGAGPADTNHFDHAYLANYLGYTLVEGKDLTVREGHVWLKTVEGLKLVDVVLRRVRDADCDPLELAPRSPYGVPGMLEAGRRGNVMLANPIGAAALENPALMAFAERMARNMLGEELLLAAPPTRWCGESREALDWAVANVGAAMVYRVDDASGAYTPALDPAALAHLKERIVQQPELYVVQAALPWSTAPVFEQGQIRPRPLVTRCFAAAEGDAYAVLQGGFSRVSADGDVIRGLSRTASGVCKDTWIIAEADEAHLIRWPRGDIDLRRPVREALASRAAESLYWLGRHAEQLEFSARVMRALLDRLFEAAGNGPETMCNERLLAALAATSRIQRDSTAALEDQLTRIVYDGDLSGSLAWLVHALTRNANAVRDRWSADAWRLMDDLAGHFPYVRGPHHGTGAVERIARLLDQLIDSLMAFTGTTSESMTRESGFRFLVIGRRVERARWIMQLLSTMAEPMDEALEHAFLDALLDCCESRITHRRRNRASISAESVFETVVLDALNPRSAAFQLTDLEQGLAALPAPEGFEQRREQRAALAASTRVRLAESHDICARDQSGGRPALAALSAEIRGHLTEVGAGLLLTYFSQVKPRQMAPVVGDDQESEA